jgi:hypothetical protein
MRLPWFSCSIPLTGHYRHVTFPLSRARSESLVEFRSGLVPGLSPRLSRLCRVNASSLPLPFRAFPSL